MVDSESGEEVWRSRLRQVVGSSGGPSAVSRLAEIPLQTLKNHLNGRTKKAPVAGLQRIAAACGVSFAWLMGEGAKSGTKRDHGDARTDDLVRFKHALPRITDHAYWRVTSAVLDQEHIVIDDLIEFDEEQRALKGQIVMAEVTDGSGKPQRVLRRFEPPYLLTHSSDRSIDRTPLEVDGETVRIVGVFRNLMRL
jgi:hypothetical protein